LRIAHEQTAVLFGEHRSADLRARCSFDDEPAQRIGHRAGADFTSLGRRCRSMSGKRSVATTPIGSRGCAATATYLGTDTNKSSRRQEIKQKNADYRWHRSALCSRACWLVFWSVKTASQTIITGASDSGKIDCRLTI